jgi:hypothetical protein
MGTLCNSRRQQAVWHLIVLCILLLSASLWAQQNKRLILKDGTWQGIREFQIQGDRVRYLSSERGEWEEVPANLVDWKATQEWNTPKENPELKKLAEEEEAERRAVAANTPTVAPGVRLPSTGGVFVLDEYNDRPQLMELTQSGSELNKNTGKNILRATINPVASSKQTFEIKGAHAHIQVHTAAPEIYINVDEAQGATKLDVGDRFKILRLESTRHDSRVLAANKITFYGRVSQQQNVVGSRAEKFSGDWVKIIPLDALERGEYAVVEMLSGHDMNLYVWDFGYDPNAPANTAASKPQPNPAGTDASPVLQPGKKR